jgi:hypothetical protein
MERIVKKEITFPKTVQCTVFGKDLPIVNCQYWSANVSECKAVCKLGKKENPSVADCAACSQRYTFEGIKKIIFDKDSNSFEIVDLSDSVENVPVIKMDEPTLSEKTKNYIKAESSQLIEGKISEETFQKRKNKCMACEFRVKTAKNATDSIGWCKGGCGCSVGNPRAALSQKLYMPSLSCPKGKFGKEEGKGFNISDAKDSATGFIKSVVNIFKK